LESKNLIKYKETNILQGVGNPFKPQFGQIEEKATKYRNLFLETFFKKIKSITSKTLSTSS